MDLKYKFALEYFVERLNKDNIRSILLFGSVSRGEETISKDGVLISDIEFIVSLFNYSKENKFRVFKQVELIQNELRQKIGFEKLKIDISIRPFFLLQFYPRNIRLFEMRLLGKTVYGKSLLETLPDVSFQNINFDSINALILVRLLNQLENIVENRLDSDAIKYATIRNYLEILTVLLPHLEILEAGYARRVNYFKQVELKTPFETSFFELCLQVKLTYNIDLLKDYTKEELIEKLINDYAKLIQLILEIKGKEYNSKNISSLLFGYDDFRGKYKFYKLKFKYLFKGINLNHFTIYKMFSELVLNLACGNKVTKETNMIFNKFGLNCTSSNDFVADIKSLNEKLLIDFKKLY